MRFKLKEPKYYRHGESRVIAKFALLPIIIDKEIIWLETVMIQQEYCNPPLWQPVTGGWINLKFIDLKEE